MEFTFNKYKKNLMVMDGYVYSYRTRVAKINHNDNTLTQLGWWSVTTQKHINYASKELCLTLIKNQ